MRRFTTALALGLLVVACGGCDQVGGGGTGIAGTCTHTVLPGPAGSTPRGPAPYAGARIVIAPVEGTQPATETVADDKGRFRVTLEPGRYRVTGPGGEERTVEVKPGRLTQVTFDVVEALPAPPPGR